MVLNPRGIDFPNHVGAFKNHELPEDLDAHLTTVGVFSSLPKDIELTPSRTGSVSQASHKRTRVGPEENDTFVVVG